MIVLGILLVIIGVIMLLVPKTVWKIADSWKTMGAIEPTDFYVLFLRVLGVILVAVGLFLIL